MALVIDDITHEKTITELKVIAKNKDLVVATITHELRTPLNSILGIVDIVKRKLCKLDVIKGTDILNLLETCKSSSVLLLSLVNSIIDFSQINNQEAQTSLYKGESNESSK